MKYPLLGIWAFALVLVLGGSNMSSAESLILENPVTITDADKDGTHIKLQYNQPMYRESERIDKLVLLNFPLPNGASVELSLERFEVFDSKTVFLEANTSGNNIIPPPDVQLYRGKINGDDSSSVFMSFSSRGYDNGFIRMDGKTYYISPVLTENSQGIFDQVFVADAGGILFDRNKSFCKTEPGPVRSVDKISTEEFQDLRSQEYFVRVYLDAANDFFTLQYEDPSTGQMVDPWNTATDAAGYLVTVVAAVNMIYERDLSTKLYLTQCRIWTTSDPYINDDATQAELEDFRDVWKLDQGQNGATGLVSKVTQGSFEGIAWRDGICNYDSDYGPFSVIELQGFFPQPLPLADENSDDVLVPAHEWGHTLGANHTFCYNPPLDSCTNTDCNDGCYCGTIRCRQGTMMSYCHFCGGHEWINLEFHPTVALDIVLNLANADCIVYSMAPVYVDYCNKWGDWYGTASDPFYTITDAVIRSITGADIYIYGLNNGPFQWCYQGGYPMPFPNGWPYYEGTQVYGPGVIPFPCTLRKWSESADDVIIGLWYEGSAVKADETDGYRDDTNRNTSE